MKTGQTMSLTKIVWLDQKLYDSTLIMDLVLRKFNTSFIRHFHIKKTRFFLPLENVFRESSFIRG